LADPQNAQTSERETAARVIEDALWLSGANPKACPACGHAGAVAPLATHNAEGKAEAGMQCRACGCTWTPGLTRGTALYLTIAMWVISAAAFVAIGLVILSEIKEPPKGAPPTLTEMIVFWAIAVAATLGVPAIPFFIGRVGYQALRGDRKKRSEVKDPGREYARALAGAGPSGGPGAIPKIDCDHTFSAVLLRSPSPCPICEYPMFRNLRARRCTKCGIVVHGWCAKKL